VVASPERSAAALKLLATDAAASRSDVPWKSAPGFPDPSCCDTLPKAVGSTPGVVLRLPALSSYKQPQNHMEGK
jgi:hypothetical protein